MYMAVIVGSDLGRGSNLLHALVAGCSLGCTVQAPYCEDGANASHRKKLSEKQHQLLFVFARVNQVVEISECNS